MSIAPVVCFYKVHIPLFWMASTFSHLLVQEDSSKPQSAISGESHYFHHSKAVVAVK